MIQAVFRTSIVAALLAIAAPAVAAECGVKIIRAGKTICNPGRPATEAELKNWPETLTPEQWRLLELQQAAKNGPDALDELFRQYPQRR